jgi:GLPGLI family protein
MLVTKNILLLLALCVGLVSTASAQKQKAPNFLEGVIKYKVELEGMPQAEQFTDNLLINVFFKDKDAKVDFAMMGGLMSVQFINNRSKDLTTMLMNIPTLYENTAVNFDKDSDVMQELMKAQNTNAAPTKIPEFEYNKRKKKRIASYPCHLAEMEFEGQTVKFYVTEKLRPEAMVLEGQTVKTLQGFPLGMELNIEGMTLKITAIDVIKQDVNKEAFEIPDSYEMKSLDEFMEEVKAKAGGMGESGVGL